MHTRHTRHTSVSYGGQDETEKQAEEEEDEGKREAPGKAEQGDGGAGPGLAGCLVWLSVEGGFDQIPGFSIETPTHPS